MLDILVVLVTLGAITRITRFGTADHMPLFVGFRRLMLRVPFFKGMFFEGGDGQSPTGCDWCLSVWVGAIVVPLAYWFGTESWFLIPASVLTASHITGWLAQAEPEGD